MVYLLCGQIFDRIEKPRWKDRVQYLFTISDWLCYVCKQIVRILSPSWVEFANRVCLRATTHSHTRQQLSITRVCTSHSYSSRISYKYLTQITRDTAARRCVRMCVCARALVCGLWGQSRLLKPKVTASEQTHTHTYIHSYNARHTRTEIAARVHTTTGWICFQCALLSSLRWPAMPWIWLDVKQYS